MGIRCAALCTERVVSPLLVLTIHGLIVADVAYYRQELWHEVSLWYRSLRLLAVATVAVYLRTCLTNPGFVSSAHATEALCSSKGCLLLCCAAFVSMSEWKDWKSKRVVPELLASTAAPSPEAETSLDPETGKLEIAPWLTARSGQQLLARAWGMLLRGPN
ncbi:unnamed protein product [Effrenium voratum]|nr:unnamed protein product [Effrenium voratum]